MYPDSPESRDVPADARSSGPSPVRATVAGGLVGGIGVMVVLILTGAIAIPNLSRKASATASSDSTAVESTAVDTTPVPVVVPMTDTVITTTTAAENMVQQNVQPVETTTPYAPPRVAESPDPPPLTPAQRVTMYRGALQEAILRADEAEIQAQRRLDSAPLYAVYTGQQLQNQLSSIESLRERGVHMDSELRNVQWHSFWVSPDEQTARVETTETWYSEYHQNGSDTCTAVVPEHDAPQRATLRRDNGVWKISSVTFTGTSPQLQACP